MDPSDMPDLGEDIDLTLRHVSRQFPGDFARALLPPTMKVTSATWLDTQVTSRQRRLDRILDVVADEQRRLEHVEWQLEWELVVMADMDKRRRNLREAILPLLREETVMQNWVYKQGEARGEARGRAEGEANALLRVLERRGVPVPEEARARILGCTSTTQIETWLDRALSAARIVDVFGEAAT